MPGNAPTASPPPAIRPSASRGRWNEFRKYKVLYLISLPGILFFLVFKYIQVELHTPQWSRSSGEAAPELCQLQADTPLRISLRAEGVSA